MKYDRMLIPPTTFSKISDERWAEAFGKVNRYVEKDTKEECRGARTYEEIVKEHKDEHENKS